MDGTLFDTERFHTQAFLKIGQDFKITPPGSLTEVHQLLVGKADHLVFEVVRNWRGFPKEWSARDFVNIKTSNLLALLKGIPAEQFFPDQLRSLLSEAKLEGFFLALVTSSEKVITQEMLKISGLDQTFNLVLTRDDCPEHKPHPWPYLKALEISGIAATQTVIFEDSQVGLSAALASGAQVVKVEWHPEFEISKV